MDQQLIKDVLNDAQKAAHQSYSPYSRFAVGAVIVLKNGERILGANIENASYPVAICAERTAMSRVVMMGQQDNVAMVAVITSTEKPGAPCGMCRQFLSEFLGADTPFILANDRGAYDVSSMGALLPNAFTKNDLASR